MKLYFKCLLVAFAAIGIFGVVGPMLISAQSTEAVVAGFCLVFLVGVPLVGTFIYRLIRRRLDDYRAEQYWNELKEKGGRNEEF